MIANQIGNLYYLDASITTTFVVNKLIPTLGDFFVGRKNFNDPSFTLLAPVSNSDGTFRFDISDTNIAYIVDVSRVILLNIGETSVFAIQEESTNYLCVYLTPCMKDSYLLP